MFFNIYKSQLVDNQEYGYHGFLRPPVSCAQCNIESEKKADAGINYSYDDENYPQVCAKNVSFSGHITEPTIYPPF